MECYLEVATGLGEDFGRDATDVNWWNDFDVQRISVGTSFSDEYVVDIESSLLTVVMKGDRSHIFNSRFTFFFKV